MTRDVIDRHTSQYERFLEMSTVLSGRHPPPPPSLSLSLLTLTRCVPDYAAETQHTRTHRDGGRGQRERETERELVSWCFEPCQLQTITSGLNTSFILSPTYSFHKSSYHKSCFVSLFIFRRHSTWEPASGRVTYFILRAYTGTMC